MNLFNIPVKNTSPVLYFFRSRVLNVNNQCLKSMWRSRKLHYL